MVVCSIKVAHEIEHFLLHLIRTAVWLVDLIDHNNRLLTHLEGLLKHKSCLRHTTLERIDEQQHSVRHIENALNLTSEVAMARGVYNIDFNSFVNH